MTCICGHHEKAHLSDIGLCAAPEGCNCNHFRKPAPNPEPFVDAAKAKQDAEWLAGSQADTAERNLARAYLAMCDEVAGFEAMWEAREQAHDAEIAEEKRERDAEIRGMVEGMRIEKESWSWDAGHNDAIDSMLSLLSDREGRND